MKIKKGATRNVLILKNIVIKLPTIKEFRLFLYGLLANIKEKNVYKNNIERDDLGVIYCGNRFGLFLVMKKYDICNNNKSLELLEFLEEKYKNDELKDFMLSDFKPSNWGMHDGRYIKIDYGDL